MFSRFYLSFSSSSLIAASLVAVLVGCSSQPFLANTACKGLDWYELGRQDGVLGKTTDALQEHFNDCSGGSAPNTDLYLNGRNAGLTEFCTAQTGLEYGRGGQKYSPVCPEHLEKNFLSGFATGRKIYLLEAENERLDLEIQTLAKSLENEPAAEVKSDRAPASLPGTAQNSTPSNPTKTQLESLKRRRAINESNINALQSRSNKKL